MSYYVYSMIVKTMRVNYLIVQLLLLKNDKLLTLSVSQVTTESTDRIECN